MSDGSLDASNMFVNLSFGGTFRRTFSIFLERLDVFVALSSLVLIPFTTVLITVTAFILNGITVTRTVHDVNGYGGDMNTPTGKSSYVPPEQRGTSNRDVDPWNAPPDALEEDEQIVFHHFGRFVLLLALDMMLYYVITYVGRGAIIRAVADVYINYGQGQQQSERISWKKCLILSYQRLVPLLTSHLIINIGIFIAGVIPYVSLIFAIAIPSGFTSLVAFILVGSYLVFLAYAFVSFAMVSPLIIIEKKDAQTSLARSWELVTSNRCYLMCCLFSMWTIHHISTQLLHTIFNTSQHANNIFAFLSNMEGIIISMVPMLIFFPLSSILETVLYFNIRVQRESLNRDVLIRDLDKEVDTHLLLMNLGSGVYRTDYNPPLDTNYQQVPLMDSIEKESFNHEAVESANV